MVIERKDNEIVIRLPDTVNIQDIQRLLDYFRFTESIATNKGTEAQAARLAREVEKKWWQENKHRFLP